MSNIKVKTLGAVLAAFAIVNGQAEEAKPQGEGALFRGLFGDGVERDYGIKVAGLLDVGYSRNNRSTSDERKDGLSNLPVTGFSDENFELGSLHLFIDKPLKAPFIPRITPLPGPKPEVADVGFTVEVVYGRNAQFARTYGWDMAWGINEQDNGKAQRDKANFLAVPNLAATAYLPYGPGFTIMAGVFGPAQGYEIPPNIRLARNPFASRTYAFISNLATVSGVMVGSRLVDSPQGLLGVELGVAQGWSNLRDNNDDKLLLGALRWRTANLQTWIDYEFMVGNQENESVKDIQVPMSRLVSPSGQLRQQHSLNAWHRFDERWSMGAELVYGRQDGDGKPSTIDILTGPGFDGAHWWGANAVVTYQARPNLSFSVRGEHFRDPDGFILFPTTTSRGNFNAITTGFRYDFNTFLSLRPELRYDWFDAREHDRPFGNGRSRDQLTATVEALFSF
ncbi:outer membrane beta-barrel protein [Pseudomonas sp. X10]